MEPTIEQIIEAIQKNPSHVTSLLPVLQTNPAFTTMLTNRVTAEVDAKIADKTSEIHSRYDNDIFEALGIRAGSKGDAKQKTYELAKELFSELATLRTQKDSLTKDAKVVELNGMIEKLKAEGGAKFVQEQFDQAKKVWETEKETLIQERDAATSSQLDYRKETAIQDAINQIKWNPDTSEEIKKMVIANVKANLVKNSKIEGDKVIFLNPDGTPAMGTDYLPKDALSMLKSMKEVEAISLKGEENKGGGADTVITGQIQTTKVEGKDVKKLVLPEGSFKSRMQFIEVAEKALADQGIAKRDPQYDELMTNAYRDLKVEALPAS